MFDNSFLNQPFDPHFLQKMQNALKNRLPGEDAHLPMSPTGRGRSSESLLNAHHYRKSAVAMILFQEEDDVRIILTQRAIYKGVHSGQVSFPGGRIEPFDKSEVDAIIRETHEEIGIGMSHESLLGKLTDVFIPVSSYLVHPFVFFLNERPLIRNNYEVTETFDISIQQLLDSRSISKMCVTVGNNSKLIVPCFDFEERKVWGATAIILNEFKVMLHNL